MQLIKPQIVFWGTSIGVFLLAQIIRAVSTQVVYNHQLAFGIAWPAFLIVPTVVLFLGIIVWWFYRYPPKSYLAISSLGIIFGGGASNLFERLIENGLVADYWDMFGFFTFNVADAGIFLGLIGLVIYFFYAKN